MLGGLGRTMCESFYFPYMKKLWGLDPDRLAPTLARRRVSGSSLPKLARKIFAQLPGLKSPTTGRFYYPRAGFGAISEAIGAQARARGAQIELGARVERVLIDNGKARGVVVSGGGVERVVEAEHVWSTLPMTTLVRAAGDAAPEPVKAAARAMRYRGIILIYLALGTDQYTEYDAHYFPELSIPISRLSEPKNYSATGAPKGVTVLCAELPADPGDPYWSMDDRALGAALYDWLGACGLPTTAPVLEAMTRRLPFAYPVYDAGYEENFDIMDRWAGSIDGLLTFGRQGLFAHDNTHHALAMAYGAVDCVTADGGFDRAKWAGYREEFETHVVED
jgi:protoporphyrinogen oxidase